MKTAISLPDSVYEAADDLAHRLGVSRSRLYATAIARYVAENQDAEITQRLNAVYTTEVSAMDATLTEMQSQALANSEW